LPSGRALSGSLEMGPRGVDVISSPPVIWATDAPVLDAGRVLRGLRQSAGALNLVPALLIGMDSQPERPWESREFSPTDPRRIDWFDAAEELAHAWRNCFEEEDEESLVPVEPFGIDFPGIAAGPRGRAFRILPGQYLAGKWHVGGVRQVTSTDQAMELLVGLTKSTRPSWTKRSTFEDPNRMDCALRTSSRRRSLCA